MKIHSSQIILVVCAVATIATSSFGYNFLYHRTIAQAENASKARSEVLIENDKKKHEQELVTLYGDTIEDRKKVAAYIVPDDGVVDLIEKIERVGSESGTDFELSSINSDNLSAAKKGTTGYIKANIETQGTWENVMRALILIENLPYSISIDNIEISSGDGFLTTSTEKAVKSRIWNLHFSIKVLMIK